MKKKIGIILAILLCIAMIFTFVACGNNDTEEPNEEKPTEEKLTISAESQAAKKADIDAFLDNWLQANAQEEGKVSDQKKSLKADFLSKAEFTFTVNRKNIKPTFTAKFNKTSTGGYYDITVTYSDSKLDKPVTFTFKKDAVAVRYGAWAGTQVQDEWLSDSMDAYTVIDQLVAAGLKTINTVTGNSITGKFGADGVLGINIQGKKYSLRVKGNVDVTKHEVVSEQASAEAENNENAAPEEEKEYDYSNKAGNEVGLVVLNEDGDEIFGIYYDAAVEAKDNRIYIQYSKTGEDGKLLRDAQNKVISYYKYINYVDILGFIKDLLPDEYKAANNGALATITKKVETTDAAGNKTETEKTITLSGLSSLLAAFDADGAESIVKFALGLLAKPYVHDDTFYVDINLGSVVTSVSDLMTQLGAELDALTKLGIDTKNLSGLLGHITLSGKIDSTTKMLKGFELAVNIPECTFYLNGERSTETQKNDKELKFDIPAVSFSIYIEDFSFLTTGTVSNVIPADASANAEYFSPTNVHLEGLVAIEHTEKVDSEEENSEDDDEASQEDYKAVYHFEFATDINPFEVVENQFNSEARGALVIKRSIGETYDPATAKNFLTISYDQKTKILTMSGIVFDLKDEGEQTYYYDLGAKFTHYHRTTDDKFKADKIYYTFTAGNYVEAEGVVVDAKIDGVYYEYTEDEEFDFFDFKNEIMLWLGLDTEHKNWHGVSQSFEIISEYEFTQDLQFKDNKTYYKLVEDKYVPAVKGEDYTVGADVPAETFYVKTAYESAKTVFGKKAVKEIIALIMGLDTKSEENASDHGETPESEENAEAGDGDVTGDINEYYQIFKDLYDKYVEEKQIDVDIVDGELVFGADVTLDMVKEVAAAIKSTLGLESINVDEITNPDEVKVYFNYVKYDLTTDRAFVDGKTYYKLVDGEYVKATDCTVGAAVTADTYYERVIDYESKCYIFVRIDVTEYPDEKEGEENPVAQAEEAQEVQYKYNTFELLFDDSTDGFFGITFTMTLASGRTYTFEFNGKDEENDTWSASFQFDIKADGEEEPENHTKVTLSNFHGHWGGDYTDYLDGKESENEEEAIEAMMPNIDEKDTWLPIFPAEDIPSVGTELAKAIAGIISNDNVNGFVKMAVKAFLPKSK